ncbi:hypothetical protein X943_001807 [Babesia divergens]|uniref:Transcription factor TFIIIB component B'' Myb domain-containing protein n=1 Tax=Babesia divergens TaxID=32595 RepID=A0AAD9GDB1_BABDI|nr:hypothetical protein X943_001807 [Babesia divergens]
MEPAVERGSGKQRKVQTTRAADETVWGIVQRLGRSQDPFERPVAVEPAQNASNVDLSFFGADVQCLLGTRHHVVGNAFNKRGQYASAYKRTKGVKWSAQDTERFYEALGNFGSDLLMIRSMLPEFTDRQIYDKFKLEEKRNPEKLQHAIRARTKIPVEKFEKRHGKIDTSQHYDPNKDPVLLQKRNQKITQLALKTQMECNQTSAPIGALEPMKPDETEGSTDIEVQGSNIMDLFM